MKKNTEKKGQGNWPWCAVPTVFRLPDTVMGVDSIRTPEDAEVAEGTRVNNKRKTTLKPFNQVAVFCDTTREFIRKKWRSLAVSQQCQCLLSLGTLVRDEEQVAEALRGTPHPPLPSLNPLTHTPVSPRVGRVVNSSESHSQYIFLLVPQCSLSPHSLHVFVHAAWCYAWRSISHWFTHTGS